MMHKLILLKLSTQLQFYLDDLLKMDNSNFDGMVTQMFPTERQLNKANFNETEAPFWDLHLLILTV